MVLAFGTLLVLTVGEDSGLYYSKPCPRSTTKIISLSKSRPSWLGRVRAWLPGGQAVPQCPGQPSRAAQGTGSSGGRRARLSRLPASRWGRPLPCSAARRAGRRGWAASAAPPSITWPERHKNNSFGQGRDFRTGNPGSSLQPRPHGGEFSRILWEAEPPAVADTGASPAAPAWDTPAPPQL